MTNKVKKIKWTQKELIQVLFSYGNMFLCPKCNDVVRVGWCCSNCGYGG